MANNIDLSSLSPSQRREEIARLAEKRLVTPALIMRLAAQGDEVSLLLAKERMERYQYEGFEYYMAMYELERKSELPLRISILEQMIKASGDPKYMLELAGLYCLQREAAGSDKEAKMALLKARRACSRLEYSFPDGKEAEEARRLLELLDQGKWKEAGQAYASYAAPRPEVQAKTEPVKVSVPISERPQPKPEPKPQPKPEPKPAPAKAQGLSVPKLREREKVQIPKEVESAFRGLVGMEELKTSFSRIYWTLTAQRERERRLGIPRKAVECNIVLLGNPGTGKTTAARRIAKLLFDLGIRRENKLIEVNRKDLVGEHIGETAIRTEECLEKALGGVFFVDEAYSLYRRSISNDFGQEAIESIIKYAGDHLDDLTVIFAGYQKQMDEMFREGNPGLASRFQYKIILPNYTDPELLQIAHRFAKDQGLTLDKGAEDAFFRQVERRRLGDAFGNAREVRDIIKKAIEAQAARLGSQGGLRDKSKLILLTAQDIESEDVGRESLEELLAKLNSLIGLDKAKEQVRRLIQSVQAQQRKQEEGQKTNVIPQLHTAFLGNPGTGKTTMARLLGRICHCLGVLKRGDLFVEAKREDLVGGSGMSASEATKKKIQEAMGGVLFIDEAYSICMGKDDRAGQEAVTCLIAEMENHKKDLMVILAGYTREMEELFSVNPGFKSRIPRNNLIEFEDYTKDQLMDIFERFLKEDHLTLEPGWRTALEPVLTVRLSQQGAEKFGNARGVRNLVDEAKQHWVDRGAVGDQITLADLVWETEDRESVDRLLAQLNALEGLDSVKKKVQETISSIQARKRDQAAGLKREGFQSLHTVFVGNPGTGKTTVAEILGKLYTALGVLPGGPVKTCTRDDLVAGYQGQTAIRVKKAIEEAMGGVLFIDEAYALCRDEHDSFGQEAVDTLVPALEKFRDSLMVILAGYPGDMERFLSKNPGLKSRFSNTFTFEDYGTEQLLHIFQKIVEKEGFFLPEGWQEVVAPQFEALRSQRGKNFGNAREARNMAKAAIGHRDNRTAELELSAEELRRIELSDMEELI